MNLRQLVTFVGIYEEGSFNKAARRLNATQSGLSVQIRNLEEALGAELFSRSVRGVKPTPAGRRLYGTAVDILRRIDHIEADFRNLKGEISGDLRIGLMPTFTRGVIGPALERFLSAHPNVQISVYEGYSAALTEKVAAAEVDFAIVPRAPEREGLRSTPLGTDREILVTRPGGALRHMTPVPLARLAEMRLVLPARGNARRDQFDEAFGRAAIRPLAVVDMDAMMATLDLIENSDFATILPATLCTRDLDGKQHSLHPICDPDLSVTYMIIEPARRAPSLAAAAFLDELQQIYQQSADIWERTLAG